MTRPPFYWSRRRMALSKIWRRIERIYQFDYAISYDGRLWPVERKDKLDTRNQIAFYKMAGK